jgi:hypothetical protein
MTEQLRTSDGKLCAFVACYFVAALAVIVMCAYLFQAAFYFVLAAAWLLHVDLNSLLYIVVFVLAFIALYLMFVARLAQAFSKYAGVSSLAVPYWVNVSLLMLSAYLHGEDSISKYIDDGLFGMMNAEAVWVLLSAFAVWFIGLRHWHEARICNLELGHNPQRGLWPVTGALSITVLPYFVAMLSIAVVGELPPSAVIAVIAIIPGGAGIIALASVGKIDKNARFFPTKQVAPV